MKKLVMVLTLLSSAKMGWACPYGDCMPITSPPDISKTFLGFEVIKTTTPAYVEILDYWTVSKGSETYALKEFAESGRLCEFRGKHEWTVDDVVCGNQRDGIYYIGTKCSICHRCRRKVKVQKEIEEWEN